MSQPPAITPAHSALSPQRQFLYLCLALVVATVCTYAGVVRCDFIGLDDTNHVIENPLLKQGLNLGSVRDAFAPHASLWVPLTWLSLLVDVAIFGFNPGAMHAVNLAWHAGSVLLLFAALRRMTGSLWGSAAVAGLFALHPLNVESVAWVTERKNVLCAFFWMLTMLVYARYTAAPAVGRYLAVMAALALALLAKPLAVTLPCALVLLDFWPLRRFERESWWRLLLEKVPLLALSAGASFMQIHAISTRAQSVPLEWVTLGSRVSNALVSYGAYLRQLVWPADLAVFYPHPVAVQTGPAIMAGTVLLVITVLALWQWRKRPYFIMGWCWFLGTLVPMIGLVQAGSQARADRFTYLAQIGVFMAVVWGLREFRAPRVAVGAASAVALALGVTTARYVACWTDSLTLFAHAQKVTGPNARIEGLLGAAYGRVGDYVKAIPHYQAALKLMPEAPETWNDFGAALTRLGQDKDAARAFQAALVYDLKASATRYNLATCLARLGDRPGAIAQFETVLQALPDFGRARFHLGRLLLEEGRPGDARPHLEEAARLLPNDAEVAETLQRLPR